MMGLVAGGIGAGYGNRLVLRDISLTFAPGSMTVLAGSNGAGKSTLLNILAGDLRPRHGKVTLNGIDIATLSASRLADRRAVLPQGSALNFPYTVYEIVRLGVRDQTDQDRTDRTVQAVLEEADLAGYGARRFQELSGGEQQRVHLARVLAQVRPLDGERPDGLFLDEPTASLDLKHQYRTMEIARRFAREGGIVVAVLHDLNLAAAHADELVLLVEGRLLAKGAPRAMLTADLLRQTYSTNPRLSTDAQGTPFLLPPLPGTCI